MHAVLAGEQWAHAHVVGRRRSPAMWSTQVEAGDRGAARARTPSSYANRRPSWHAAARRLTRVVTVADRTRGSVRALQLRLQRGCLTGETRTEAMWDRRATPWPMPSAARGRPRGGAAARACGQR
eukprot:1715117-Prymnesium_polylepis.1